SRFHIVLKITHSFFCPARISKSNEGNISEKHKSARSFPLYRSHVLHEVVMAVDVEESVCAIALFITAPAEVDHNSHVQLIHFFGKPADILAWSIPLMIVHINKWKFCPC